MGVAKLFTTTNPLTAAAVVACVGVNAQISHFAHAPFYTNNDSTKYGQQRYQVQVITGLNKVLHSEHCI